MTESTAKQIVSRLKGTRDLQTNEIAKAALIVLAKLRLREQQLDALLVRAKQQLAGQPVPDLAAIVDQIDRKPVQD